MIRRLLALGALAMAVTCTQVAVIVAPVVITAAFAYLLVTH